MKYFAFGLFSDKKDAAHNMKSTKERVLWADICKGLLITLLMFSHLVWLSRSRYDISNSIIDLIGKYSCVWNCFFMSCFFILSGMFSNYNKPIKPFIYSKFKTLIIPALVSLALISIPSLNYKHFFVKAILSGGGQWFLTSLFLSHIFLYLCIKFVKKRELVVTILLALSFASVFLDKAHISPNFCYYRNFLNFSLFLGIGYYFKDLILKRIIGVVSTIAFMIILVILVIQGVRIPNVVSIFNETIWQHPLTILLSLTGSVTCIHVCMIIKHNTILEYLGRISLIIYLYHMIFLTRCIPAVAGSLNGATIINSVIIVFMIVVSTLAFTVCVDKLMEVKYLRWMKGKF